MRREERRLGRLLDTLRGARRVLVLIHDHPDPDALASGWVLRQILRHKLGPRVDLAYGGLIARAENRAMVDLLRIPAVYHRQLRFASYGAIALVDTQPGTGNNSLPAGHSVQAVIDHHPLRRGARGVPFCDVRPAYGATATILSEYLHAAGMAEDRRTATALFYAIRSETQNLGREATAADARAFAALFPRVNNLILARIEEAPVSRGYLAVLDRACRATRLYDGVAITRLDRLPYPDAAAQLADLLARVERVRWSLVLGCHGGQIYLSARTTRRRANAGRLLRRIVGTYGKAGGHGTMAGGRVDPACVGQPARVLLSVLTSRALAALHAGDASGLPLLPAGTA